MYIFDATQMTNVVIIVFFITGTHTVDHSYNLVSIHHSG